MEISTVPVPRLVAWEITRGCNLSCAHCRASANPGPYPGELSTKECFTLVDGIVEVAKPILILTGGEPLMRKDFFEIAKYASGKGLRAVVGTNGTVVTADIARKMKEVPIARVAVSLDFPTRDLQDAFRGKAGAFDEALRGIEHIRNAGIELQINSTITKLNAPLLGDLVNLALDLGAVAFHPFLLVPTGRGKDLADKELPPAEYEGVLNWIYDKQKELGSRIFFKPTDVPHYMRVKMQRASKEPVLSQSKEGGKPPEAVHGHPGHPGGHPGGMSDITRGCLAGIGFCFISHVGRVQGCGYLDVEAGNIKKSTFAEVWRDSRLFNELRDYSNIKGRCGVCEFKKVCGGCRARAYEATGDYLEAEPYCIYQPKALRQVRS